MNKTNEKNAPRCRAITSKGQPCLSYAQNDSEYCFTHDPARTNERNAARELGGKISRMEEPPSPFPEQGAETAAGLSNILSTLIRDTWNHKASAKRARTIAALVRLQQDMLSAAKREIRQADNEADFKRRFPRQ